MTGSFKGPVCYGQQPSTIVQNKPSSSFFPTPPPHLTDSSSSRNAHTMQHSLPMWVTGLSGPEAATSRSSDVGFHRNVLIPDSHGYGRIHEWVVLRKVGYWNWRKWDPNPVK